VGGAGPGPAPSGDPNGAVTVQLTETKQTIAGFGINNTWAAAMDDAEADALFDVDKGLGLTILRVGMNSSGGFMSDNISGDITKAKARGTIKIIGSCWSPPGGDKSGQTPLDSSSPENNGGHVDPTKYDSWGSTIAKFAKDNGLYAMSIANEPDFASCGTTEPCNGNYPTTLYTAKEMVEFVKVAGKKLQDAGVLVIAPEASEWLHNWSNESASGSEPGNKPSSDPLKCGFPATSCADGEGYDYGHALWNDKTAWAAFDIMGVHEYDTQHAEPWPSDVTEKKPVWQTEMSGVKWWPEQGPSDSIENAVAVAGWIHSALVVGDASAWLWWWYHAVGTDDNEGLVLKNKTEPAMRYYAFGNYSRFVRPDYVRVDITGAIPADVLLSAFTSPDGKLVLVAINKGTADTSVPITIAGGTAPTSFKTYVTADGKKLVAGDDGAVAGGVLTAALGKMSVTTFVGM
jgi:glucuronoarabinoxylan endo-1,4-beta-xylanase